jgi:hypothetical protein
MEKIFLFLIIIFLNFNLGVAAEKYLLRILVQYERKTAEVITLMVEKGTLFAINYEHSIFQTPQKEVYLIQNGSMKLEEIVFGNMEAAFYYNPSSDIIYRQENLWKILPANPSSYENLKIRIPYRGRFFLEANHSIIWTPQDEDRGALLIVKIEP